MQGTGIEALIDKYQLASEDWLETQYTDTFFEKPLFEEINEEPDPVAAIIGNHDQVEHDAQFLIANTYAAKSVENYYFVVAKPFNKDYNKNMDWYKSKKAFKAVLRMCKDPKEYFMTREVIAAKAHINMICYSPKDLVSLLHDKNKFRYRYYVVPVSSMPKLIDYIIKESKQRVFVKEDDYIFADLIHYN